MNTRWAVRFDRQGAAAAGGLRLRPVEVCEADDALWLRGEDFDESLEAALHALPGARRFDVLSDGQLRAAGTRVPKGRLPDGPWVPLAKWLRPVLPTAALPGRAQGRVELRLVRSSQAGEPSLLLTEFALWREYAATAPQVRLERWTFAVRGAGFQPARVSDAVRGAGFQPARVSDAVRGAGFQPARVSDAVRGAGFQPARVSDGVGHSDEPPEGRGGLSARGDSGETDERAGNQPAPRDERAGYQPAPRGVLVRGTPLPPLPGTVFVERQGVAVPAGWTWSPAVDAEIVRDVLDLEAGDVALLDCGGTFERIAAGDFVRATRSAVRLTEEALHDA